VRQRLDEEDPMADTTPVTSHPPGAFCWIELATSDQNGGKEFYGKLFGWTFEDMPMGPGETYTMFKLRGKDVAAGYRLDPKKQPGVPPHWMLYVTTADADATAAKSAELGGETVAAPFDVFDAGRMAVLKIPVGATFCVWQPKSNPGIGIQNEPGSFCWGQLNTNDTAKSEAYYVALFGWDAKTGTGGGMTYTEFRRGGVPFGGMMALPPGLKAPAHWLAYFAVADVDAAAARAVSLGAKVCAPPTTIEGAGRFAAFTDPQGAAFAIYKE
jgi:predicted enzyme related to lactoylglutathione lyase